MHRARRRPLADDQVELEILHRRIEDLLDRRIEPVDLVDEQDVALLEVGEQRREVAGLGDHRAGGGAEVDAELARDDLRQRGLAEARRADEQHVVERLAARARGLDEHLEVGARLRLADELVEPLRAQRGVGASSSRRSGVTRRRGGVVMRAIAADMRRRAGAVRAGIEKDRQGAGLSVGCNRQHTRADSAIAEKVGGCGDCRCDSADEHAAPARKLGPRIADQRERAATS